MQLPTSPAAAYPAAYPAAVQQPAHVWDYWAVVMKRIILVILFCVVSVAISWFITRQQQKLYRATAVIQIQPPSVLGPSDAMFTPAIVNDEVYLATQLAILAIAETVNEAVKTQNLSSAPDFAGKSEAEIARMAYGRVECSRRRGLYLVDVSVIGPEAKVLDDLTNALVKTFVAMQKSASKQMREDRKASLEGEISQADTQIHLLQMDITSAQSGANFTPSTFESDFERILASCARFEKLDDEIQVEIMQAESIVDALQKARQDPDRAKAIESVAQLPFVLHNPKLNYIDDRLVLLKDQRDSLLRDGILANNEKVRVIDTQIEQAARDRTYVIEREAERYLRDYQDKVNTHERLQKQIEHKTQEMTAASTVKRKVDEKNGEIDRHKVNKAAAIRQLEILAQNASDEKEAVKIETIASEPNAPYSPNAATNLTMGLVFGIVGGVGLAFLLDYLDDTIRTKDELAKIAPDVPLLGIVPNIEARKSEITKKDLFAANQPKSTISEAYRGVRTALTLSVRGPQQKVMLLTSAGPREGKTTTAINLATVLAFSGARTLIIDADLRKPRVHASFALANKRGLTNLIVGEDDPVEYCQRTTVERVDVLTSGPIPPNPSELLGRPRMREVLRRLRDRYDQIVVDTPPIGAVTDAAVIATMVDGVILVVHAGKTRRQIVSRGIEQLRYISAPIIGVILNNLHLGRGRYYPGYYHYYYYYASHYGAEEAKAKKQKAGKGAAQPESPPGGGNPQG